MRFDARGAGRETAALSVYAFRRFQQDRCLRVAASLSYTTLLALVPLLTIGFAMFAAFPVFERVQTDVEEFLFSNMVPELGDVVGEQLRTFVANTGSLTAVGLIVIAITALMMFATVENAFNVIWRVGESRPLLVRLMIFWAVLTIGPMLMGASVAMSSYIFTLTRLMDIEAFTGPLGRLLRLVPFVLEIAAFSVVYLILPNRKVNWRHAIAGGLVAALLLEGLKKGFAFYIGNFPSQETIYGALSAIPLFLVWMYVAWAAVLIGAEIVAALPEYRRSPEDRMEEGGPRRERFTLALATLADLARCARLGEGGRSMARLQGDLGVGEEDLGRILERLRDAGYVAESTGQTWLLARDLSAASLHDLFRDLGLDVRLDAPAADTGEPPPWYGRVERTMAALEAARREVLREPLATLLAADDGAAEPPRTKAD